METASPRFLPRIPERFQGPFWLLWLAFVVMLSWKPLLWHIDYFAHPGPQFRTLILAFLPLMWGAAFGYRFLRKSGLWRWEARLLAAGALAFCVFFEPAATAVIVWIFAACYASGRWLRSRLGLDPLSAVEDLALSSVCGLAMLFPALFLLGLARLYTPPVFVLLFAAPCVVFHRELRRLPQAMAAIDRGWIAAQRPNDSWTAICVAFGAVFAAMPLMAALAPSIATDALLRHIPIVRWFIEQGGNQPLPSMGYSYNPQAIETLMAAAYSLAGQPAMQLVNPLTFVLTVLLTYALARQCGLGRSSSLIGVFFTFTIPFLHWNGSIIKNDYGWALFQLSALFCYLRARSSPNPNWLRAGVFFVATSFSIKHIAIFGAIPLALFYAWETFRRPRRFRLAVQMLIIFVVFGVYWHTQTYLLTGNPVYPNDTKTAVESHVGFDYKKPSRLPQYFTYPWVVHFEGWRTLESPSYNPSGLFLFLFAPVWLFLRRRRRQSAECVCLIFAAGYYLYWIYVLGLIRFAIPLFLVLAVLTGGRLAAWYARARSWLRASVQIATAYSLTFGMLVAMILEVNAPQLRLFSMQIDKKGYLRQALGDLYTPHEFLRSAAAPGDWIFSVDNCVHAYAPEAGRFVCARFRRNEPGRVARVRRAFDHEIDENWSWAIVPRKFESVLVPALNADYRWEPQFSNDRYRVYRLEPRAGAPNDPHSR